MQKTPWAAVPGAILEYDLPLSTMAITDRRTGCAHHRRSITFMALKLIVYCAKKGVASANVRKVGGLSPNDLQSEISFKFESELHLDADD